MNSSRRRLLSADPRRLELPEPVLAIRIVAAPTLIEIRWMAGRRFRKHAPMALDAQIVHDIYIAGSTPPSFRGWVDY